MNERMKKTKMQNNRQKNKQKCEVENGTKKWRK